METQASLLSLTGEVADRRGLVDPIFGAETLALSDAADKVDYVRGLLFEILQGPAVDPRLSEESGVPVHWATDSKDLFDTLSKEGATSHASTGVSYSS